MASLTVPASVHAEEQRIRAAYARRAPGDRESWFDAAHRFMVQDRERRVLSLLAAQGFDRRRLQDAHILDVGCGTGQWLRDFVKWGARPEHLIGVDLLADRVEAARRLCGAGTTVVQGNGTAFPAPGGSFDLVVQSLVFTSILDVDLRRAVAAEMVRLVRGDGLILWYDYHVDNPANRDVRGVTSREIRDLFRGCDIELHRVTLAPPLARLVAPVSVAACALLDCMPLLRTHYLGAIRKVRP